MREDVDVVIAWVDGDDPAHRAKRIEYGGKVATTHNDVGGDMRFRATGEIYFCVASILRYAPWVRRIWIVTDNQDPHIEEFVARHFPNNTIPIKLVDHKVIFEGYEEHLPTFNSISIETMMWRIPGLAERFVYFNDDLFLASPIEPAVWFEGEITNFYANKVPTLAGRLLRWIKPRKNGRRVFGHKDAMVNAAQVLGADHFWHFPHAPAPLRKSFYERFFEERTDLLQANIRHRFREDSQYSFVSLFYIEGSKRGIARALNPKDTTLFLKPFANKVGYMERKLREADSNPRLLFGCINSLGETTAQEQALFIEWIERRLGITTPQ